MSGFAHVKADFVSLDANQPVSRGVLIQNAIEALEIPLRSASEIDVPYQRVSSHMLPYVDVAYRSGALRTFGDRLGLSRLVTRGEALEFTSVLLSPSSVESDRSFLDLETNVEQQIVAIALANGWMDPVRGSVFGYDQHLSASDAQILFRNAYGVEFHVVSNDPPKPHVDQSRSVQDGQSFTVHIGDGGNSDALPLDILEEVASLIDSHYYKPGDVDRKVAMDAAIKAYVEALDDPHSVYLPTVESQEFTQDLDGELSGIGARVEEISGRVTVVAPLTGSPAEAAGILPGDQILKVDGEDIVGIGFIEGVRKIRGPKGSQVVLTIARNGATLEITVIRDTIEVPELDLTWHGRVAHIQLYRFGSNTQDDLRDMLKNLRDETNREATGIILDVRNNPGGYLDTAVSVGSNFLPSGSVVARFQYRTGEILEVTNDEPTVSADIPVIVLVNGGSASSSEIVAGALQDHDRAVVLGETTFGKGTAQTLVDFTDGSSLKFTTAEWFTPNGNEINEVGIEPDIEVPFSQDRDEQLLRALKILQ